MSRIITAQTLFAFVYIPLVSLIFAKSTYIAYDGMATPCRHRQYK